MQTPRGPDDRSAAMIRKRSLAAAAAVLWLAPMLGSCGGFVADHWPHWAGGLPPDAPPRPGAPGYEEFIAHGEAPPAPSLLPRQPAQLPRWRRHRPAASPPKKPEAAKSMSAAFSPCPRSRLSSRKMS